MSGRIKYVWTRGGLRITARKTLRTIKRYGITPEKMCKKIEIYSNILRTYDILATFFIPVKTLEENEKIILKIQKDNIEYGAHGYVHIDYTSVDRDVQENHIRKMVEIFSQYGIKEFGFRAPYGAINNSMLDLLNRYNVKYDSSSVYLFENILKEFELNINLRNMLYKKAQFNKITRYKKIVRIPFSLPDDEILVDKLNYGEREISKIWIRMLEEIERTNTYFILQLHPHRINELKNALKNLLKEATDRNIKIMPLSEIEKLYSLSGGRLPKEPILSVTGDVDALRLGEFLK